MEAPATPVRGRAATEAAAALAPELREAIAEAFEGLAVLQTDAAATPATPGAPKPAAATGGATASVLPRDSLAALFRILGQAPVDGELESLAGTAGVAAGSALTLDDVLRIVALTMEAGTTELRLRALFDGFDTDNDGVVSAADLRAAYSSYMGVELSPADVAAMLTAAGASDAAAGVPFPTFCTFMKASEARRRGKR